MNYIRNHWRNITFVIFLLLILFTPVGTFLKVKLNQAKLLVVTPSSIEINEREVLTNYDWTLKDANGKTINFKQLEGAIVLINLWATWCPPCVAEMPSLEKLHADYGKKITFMFVASDDPKKVNAFMEKNGYELPVYYATSNVPEKLFSRSIPATFLIDDQGKIVMKEIGSSNWNSQQVRQQIDELIAFSLAE